MKRSVAREHHYLPEFYLRRFCNDDGQVARIFKGPDGTLYDGAFTPKKIGRQRDLYSIQDGGPGFSVARTDVIETDLFGPIDNDAAMALKVLIEQGPDALAAAQREQWAMFVSSLLQRHPRYVNERDARARDLVQNVIDELGAKWGPPPSGTRDVLASLNIERVARYSFRAHLAKTIRDPQLVKQLSELFTVTITVPAESPVKFVTGDNPVVVNFGEPGPIRHLTLALSPTVLLFCQNTKESIEDDDPVRELVLVQNPLVIKQCEFVFSREPLSDGVPLRLRKCAQDALPEVSEWPRNQARPRTGRNGAGNGPAEAPPADDG
jgi:Protein of unknown function (DUF4238)